MLLACTFHELCHGWVAYMLGDDTAKAQGRLTLNPLAHIDPLGLICMIIAGIGWAKPVPVNPGNFRMRNKKVGMALTAIAGPISNVILSFILILISGILTLTMTSSAVAMALSQFLMITANLSLGLAVFNLLPIPPLDGSKVLMPILPNKVLVFFYKYEGYIRLALIAVLIFGLLDSTIIAGRNYLFSTIVNAVMHILLTLGIV